MARQPRYALSGQPQHVIQRGNNRSPIFFAEEDYRQYLHWLQVAAAQHRAQVHAYVLMTNHVHLLVTPQASDSIPKVLQSVGRRYVQYINYMYQRTGTLWEGRYRATLIDSESYLLTCYRYIELNPVRAALGSEPGDYPWSSYAFHTHGEVNPLIQDHPLYLDLGQSDKERRDAYRALFEEHLSEATLQAVREATNKAWVLGDEKFKTEIQTALQRRVKPLPRGGNRRKREA